MMMRSTLSVRWPMALNCTSLALVCLNGSNSFWDARIAAGSRPVYDWGLLFDTPPGQYEHLP